MTYKSFRLAFATQTNTVLPVLAYLSETSKDTCKDIILINSQHLAHPESRHASELSISRLVESIAPRIHFEAFRCNLPRVLVEETSVFRRIKAIKNFKNQLHRRILELKTLFGIDSDVRASWVTDVGIRNLTAYGYVVSPGELIMVPHEMRHFDDYTIKAHQFHWGAPGIPGAVSRRLARILKWSMTFIVGCRQPPLFWPQIKRYRHISYNEPLAWHPKSTKISGVHCREWYERTMSRRVPEYAEYKGTQILVLLSQVHDHLDRTCDQVAETLSNVAQQKDLNLHIKMHPQEIGRWEEFCQALEKRTRAFVVRDDRINCYPTELWLAVVSYKLVIGFSSGGMVVARDVYNTDTVVVRGTALCG